MQFVNSIVIEMTKKCLNNPQIIFHVNHMQDHMTFKMASVRKFVLGNIVPAKTVFFCCDMQERFRLAIKHFKDIVECADRLVRTDQ